MAVFTGDEIFRIAIELEQLGEQFYEALGDVAPQDSIKALCRDLAEQEQLHAKTFEQLRVQTTQRTASRPLSWDELSFAHTLVEERVMPDPDVAREVAASKGVAEVLDMAIGFEKDSILFFQEIYASVDEADRAAIVKIIDEEKAHAQRLIKIKRDVAS